MTTKTMPVKQIKTWPLEKTDIHYDPASEQVLIKHEKFDAFVKYVQALEERLEAAEDACDLAEYRARKAGKTADLLQALADVVLEGTTAIRDWLSSGHTLQELSDKTSIPYATCHRIVHERFGTPSLEFGHLERMLSALSKGTYRRKRGPGTVF